MISNNELTKQQIIALINRVNENDVKILQQHRDIKNEVKQTVKDTKVMNQDVDARLRSFKNITNANMVGLTDRVNTSTGRLNRSVEGIKSGFTDQRMKTDIAINELRYNHSNLSETVSDMNSEFSTFKSQTADNLRSNADYATDLNRGAINFIGKKFDAFLDGSVKMDDKATAVLNNIRDITNKKMVGYEKESKRQDDSIRKTISNVQNEFKKSYMREDQLENQLNKRYFEDNPDYNSMNGLIATTTQNRQKLGNSIKRLDANDSKISSIQNEYLKKSDVTQQLNKSMPYTDIFKDVQNNEDAINRLDQKIATNVETIDQTNAELKDMLKGITGMNGGISLNDLQSRIEKNAESIKNNTTRTKLEIMQQVKKTNKDLVKRIDENKSGLEKRVSSEKGAFNKAFSELIDSETVSNTLKESDVELNNVNAESLNIGKDLVVQGVKFSSVMNDLKKSGISGNPGGKPVMVPVYSRDFRSTDKISPNKSVSFNPETNLEMRDGKFGMNGGTFDLNNTVMTATDSDISWKKNESKVDLNGEGLNLHNSKLQVKSFENIKNDRDENMTTFIDNKIKESQSASGGFSDQVRKAVQSNPAGLEAKSLFIGGESDKMNVKTEIDNVKNNLIAFKAENGARQKALFFTKENTEDLHREIRKDTSANFDKYVPDDAKFKQISSEDINVGKLNLRDDSMNNIKLNGTPLVEALDKRYALQAAEESAPKKIISNIEVNPQGNELVVVYTDSKIPAARVKLPENPMTIKTISIEGNKLVIEYNNNVRKTIELPESDSFAKAEDVEKNYAKNKVEDASVVYLDKEQKDRLTSMVGDDNVSSLKEFNAERLTQSENELKATKAMLSKVQDRAKYWDLADSRLKSQINLQTVNNYTMENKGDTFIRLNDNVALRANGNRVQMCQNLDGKKGPSDSGYDADKNCFDMWTTADIKSDDSIKIQKKE